MSHEDIVIIGAGQGGLQAAMCLRQEGHEGSITLIGDEPGLPYQRPPLSKEYLKTGVADNLVLRPEKFFETKQVSLFSDTRVDSIDRQNKLVHAGGRTWHYDHLILATGTRNLRPPIVGADDVPGLRTLHDARRLRDSLARYTSCRIIVIGAGFIGLEFAAVARLLGHHVDVAEASPRLMSRVVSPMMSDRFLQLHERLGTGIHLGSAVTAVEEGGVRLADGSLLSSDLVLMAAGVQPNVELAVDAGLAVANGVVVNSLLRTEDPAVFALGDCAAFPDPQSGRLVRLESVQAASDHARHIARVVVKGETQPYSAVPWFWSDQSDWKLQIAGLAMSEDDSVVADESTVLRFRDDRLCAVETVNNARVHMKARRLLALDEPPSRQVLASQGNDLTSL